MFHFLICFNVNAANIILYFYNHLKRGPKRVKWIKWTGNIMHNA
jgi:hypothetical protein